jgi:hypothetical protein
MVTKALLVVLCALSPAALGQGGPPSEPNMEASPSHEQQDPGGAPSADAPPPPMTIDDARMNFATIVESFIAARSPKGYWPLKQKSADRVLRLKHEKTLPKTVRKIGEGLYTGRVVLLEADEGFAIQAEFTVDLSGARWQVKRMRLVGAPPARAAAKAPPESPAGAAPLAPPGGRP